MNPANVLALGAFFFIFMVGVLVVTVRDMMRKRPDNLIKERVAQVAAMQNVAQTVQVLDDTADLFKRKEETGFIREWLAARNQRIRSVSGQGGVRLLWSLFGVSILGSLIIVKVATLPVWGIPLVLIVLPALAWSFIYKRMISRFRTRFLKTFPDTIDLIVRAVRAGIPAVQAISVAGKDADEPVRSEFRVMGDSLRLGVDLKDVLDAAVARIQIADFSFFTVCLLLQRETGGALTETLENLATIIRARRDMRLKIRALTGEGRIASQIISAIPFFILGSLYLLNRDYIIVLFDTAPGKKLLTIAAVLMAMGTILINKIANLDTSR
jgi:tight adherence protein B